MPDHTFTVFTATYNRAEMLERLFRSLTAQTCRDFEWIVIDDGSADGTDRLVENFRKAAPFPVTYEWQRNQGKHVAHNRAVELARGELFVIVDSDDELAPEALERFRRHWSSLGGDERGDFLGVGCFCRNGRTGRVIGRPHGPGPVKVNAIEYLLRRRIDTDIAACVRTDILRSHPFPVIEGVKLVPEGMIWNRILRRYRILMTGEVLKTMHFADDGYTRNRVRSYRDDAAGRYLHYLTNLNENSDLLRRFGRGRYVKDLIQLGRMAFHARRTVGETRRGLQGRLNRTLFLLCLPVARTLYWKDRLSRA